MDENSLDMLNSLYAEIESLKAKVEVQAETKTAVKKKKFNYENIPSDRPATSRQIWGVFIGAQKEGFKAPWKALKMLPLTQGEVSPVLSSRSGGAALFGKYEAQIASITETLKAQGEL